MRSVRISWKTAQAMLGLLGDMEHNSRGLDMSSHSARDELRAAMAPKKFVKAARKEKTAKKKTKQEETAAIREAVMKRAGGLCECGCGQHFWPGDFYWRAELDHFFPKGRTKQTVETCWAIAAQCHRSKTSNDPDPEFWLGRFVEHAERYGYTSEARLAQNRLESLSLSQQSEGR